LTYDKQISQISIPQLDTKIDFTEISLSNLCIAKSHTTADTGKTTKTNFITILTGKQYLPDTRRARYSLHHGFVAVHSKN
jgi:hypothetical protein